VTKHLHSLGEMAAELAMRVPLIAVELHHGLEKIVERIEKTAKAEFGHYQPATGPFPQWPELADATQEERARLGFTENDPLLRTGARRDSIEHKVDGLEGLVGSTDEKMPFSEFGTATEPARPVLGPAAFRNRSAIEKLVGAAVVSGLIGRDQIHAALGYDFETKD
jgi:hypothetical protein